MFEISAAIYGKIKLIKIPIAERPMNKKLSINPRIWWMDHFCFLGFYLNAQILVLTFGSLSSHVACGTALNFMLININR